MSAALGMDDLLAAVSRQAAAQGIAVRLSDRDAGPESALLAGDDRGQESVWPEEILARTTSIDFAGRRWELHTRALPRYIEQLRSWAAWGTIAVGVLTSAMLGALLLITTGNRRRIQALVEHRTAELQAASVRLHENRAALIDAQRIARLGSWETLCARDGLHASDELHLLLDSTAGDLNSLADLIDAIAPASRAALTDALEPAATEPGRIMLDCNTDSLQMRTLQFRIEGEHVGGRLRRIRGTAQDVTALREAEARILYLARFDPLTGLLNRSAWQDHAQDVLRHAARHDDRCAVLFLDLDDFKTVNDSLGHAAGDRLLAQVACRLGGCVRAEDLVARIGGDEFVILLSRLAQAEEPARVAERVLDALARPLQIDSQPLRVGAMFGDGAARQGALYESFNMAMTWKLPVLYICENNMYAMGTSVTRTSNVHDLAKNGLAFDMPSETIDGMSPESVHEGLQRAAAHIRSGKGPYYLENKTYRYRGHSVSDPAKYRTKEELEAYKDRDPVVMIQNKIISEKIATQKEVDAIIDAINIEVDNAMEFAENSSYPVPSELYEDNYTQKDYPYITD